MKTKILGNKEKRGRRFTAPLALSTVFIMVFASMVVVNTVSANGTKIDSLPYVINNPGEYYLDDDLICNVHDAAGITIQADNVVIDGRGHSITGSTLESDCTGFGDTWPCTASGIYNYAAHDHIVIKDLEVEHFGTGIVLGGQGGNSVQDIIIEDCSIHDNGFSTVTYTMGIHIVKPNPMQPDEPSVIIRRNNIYDNKGASTSNCNGGGAAIYACGAGGPSSNVVITCNKLYDNDFTAYWSKQHCTECTISYNEIYGNGYGSDMVNYRKGGIAMQCAGCKDYDVSYNYIHNNNEHGIFAGGYCDVSAPTIFKNNNIVNNDNYGIRIWSSGGGGDARNNKLYDNVVCGHTTDVAVKTAGLGNTGDNNCAVTSSNYQDDSPAPDEDFAYDCSNLVPCYYDYDFDGHYSKAICSCQNLLDVGSCCNIGQYDGSDAAKIHHDAYADCIWSEGNDPNDCHAYTITGNLYQSNGVTLLESATVTLTRVYPYPPVQIGRCIVDGSSYTANLEPELDINSWNMLRITAIHDSTDGWTDHKVHTCDIAALGFSADVSLENYVLNYEPCFPYYQWENSDWSGPAVMQSCIGHYIETPSQINLDSEGRTNNLLCNQGLPYVDPEGMETTMDNYLHPEGHNYGIYNYDNDEDGRNHALHKICYWQKLGPAAVPTLNGDYSNWMAVRGIRTNDIPDDYSAPYDYVVKGFWVNDPAVGGIGENIYIDADTWNTIYYLPLTELTVSEDPYNNKYICIVEPPDDITQIPEPQITIVRPVARFVDTSPVPLMKTVLLDGTRIITRVLDKDKKTLDVVQAAIDGVSDELLPYDSEFADVFVKLVASSPMLVDDGDNDYWLVPFNEPLKQIKVKPRLLVKEKYPLNIQKLSTRAGIKQVTAKLDVLQEKTSVVVRIAADDGRFLDASWVTEGVEYLPIDKTVALNLIFEQMKYDTLIGEPLVTELVRISGSLYYPTWHIAIGESEYFVSQDGDIN